MQRHRLCHDSLLSHGGEDVCSHAPVVRLKNPGLLHSLEQCRSTHGCLVGKELVIPLLLHLLAPLLSTSLLLTPQASAFCLLQQAPSAFPGHRVTRKQAAPFLFFLQRHRWRQAAQPAAQVVFASSKSFLILKIKCCPIKPNPLLPPCLKRPAGDKCESPISKKGNEQW